jgi:hypothetical protein
MAKKKSNNDWRGYFQLLSLPMDDEKAHNPLALGIK